MSKYYTYVVEASKRVTEDAYVLEEGNRTKKQSEIIIPIGEYKGTVIDKKNALKYAFRQNPELLNATIVKIEVY